MGKKLTKSLEKDILDYNKKLAVLESLKFKIEQKLDNDYSISEFRDGFGRDEVFDIYECCSDEFNLETIKKVINAQNEFEEKVGEFPELCDLKSTLEIEDED